MYQIEITVSEQRLRLFRQGLLQADYRVSTAVNGTGEQEGSECTPLGRHLIAAKIGGGLPLAAALQGRQFSGDICNAERYAAEAGRDWILSRILWLEGLEPGRNKGHNAAGKIVDSMRRYIYIHGTPDEEPMGIAKSHGCIRMRNQDVIELYALVSAGTPVLISQ